MLAASFNLFKEIIRHPANHGSQAKALIRALYWQCSKRIAGRSWDIAYHGKVLRCFPDSHSASRAIYFSSLPDYWEMRFILDYLRPGDAFVDVGANVGLYTILALALVGDHGLVHAFEPNPEVASRLRESLALNGSRNVNVHEIGLSDEESLVTFSAGVDDCMSHIAPLPGGAETHVKANRIDRVLDEIPYAMIKFDIEGHEPLAIRGASEWTKKANPPVMLVEMAGYSRRVGVGTSEFIAALSEIGYFTAVYEPASRRLVPTQSPWDIPVENVLVIAEEKLRFVEARLQG